MRTFEETSKLRFDFHGQHTLNRLRRNTVNISSRLSSKVKRYVNKRVDKYGLIGQNVDRGWLVFNFLRGQNFPGGEGVGKNKIFGLKTPKIYFSQKSDKT